MIDLKQRRKELNMTMREVANKVGVSEATISRYESGHILHMGEDKIKRYAKALQVPPSSFIDDEDNEKNAPDNIKDVVEMLPNGISINSFNSMLNDMTDTDIDSLLDFARYLRWKHNQVQ